MVMWITKHQLNLKSVRSMGLKLSKYRKASKECNCSLYHHSKHCCLQQCFSAIDNVATMNRMEGVYDCEVWRYNEAHEEAVKTSLLEWELHLAADVVQAIFMFLIHGKSANGYYALCHSKINNVLDTTGTLCGIWRQHFFGELDHRGEIKITVLGHQGAGKSTLVLRFVAGKFVESCDPVIEDSYRKSFCITQGFDVLMDILDTAGQQEFSSMQDRWLRETQIALFCFAINETNALDECINAYDKCLRIFEYDATDHFSRKGMLLVACKMDLMRDAKSKCSAEEKRIMNENYDIALKLSEIWNVPLIETSAKEGINVNLLFKQCILEYWIQTQTRSINVDTEEHTSYASYNMES
eukprot:915898_1